MNLLNSRSPDSGACDSVGSRLLNFGVLVNDFPAVSETFILNRIAGLVERGHSVDIFALKPRDEAKVHATVHDFQLLDRTFYASKPQHALVDVDKLAWRWVHRTHAVQYPRYVVDKLQTGRSAASLRLFFPEYPKTAKASYDIILCFFGVCGLRGLELRKLGLSGKLVTTFHGFDLGQMVEKYGEELYDELFKSGDLFVPVCEYFKQKLTDLGCDEAKIVVHRNGVNLGRFTPKQGPSTASGKVRLVIVARLVPKKGINYALHAVANAIKLRPELELDIIGEGPERASLEGLIDNLGLRDVVRLRGLQEHSEVVRSIEASDLAINASVVAEDGDVDGIPNVLKEAMAAGLPVIASSVAGIPELVQDGVSGFLVGQSDVRTMTERIVQLVDNPDLRFTMGRNGRAFVESEFNLQTLMEREIALYRQLLK